MIGSALYFMLHYTCSLFNVFLIIASLCKELQPGEIPEEMHYSQDFMLEKKTNSRPRP